MSIQETIVSFNANGQSNAIDTSEFLCCAVQITGPFVGTLQFEQSNDGVNYVSADGVNITGQVSPVNSVTAPGMYIFATLARWLRFRVSAYTSGNINIDAICNNEFAALKMVTRVESYGGSASPTITQESVLTTQGGLTQFKRISTADVNAIFIKAAAGRVYGYSFQNTTAAYKFVKLYNKATAPVVGTDTPIRTIGVPPNGEINYFNQFGLAGFAAGIAFAITGASPDADATAVAVGDVIGAVDFA